MQPAAADMKKRKKGKEWKEKGKRGKGEVAEVYLQGHIKEWAPGRALRVSVWALGSDWAGGGGEGRWEADLDHVWSSPSRPSTSANHTSAYFRHGAYLKRCSQHTWQRADPLSEPSGFSNGHEHRWQAELFLLSHSVSLIIDTNCSHTYLVYSQKESLNRNKKEQNFLLDIKPNTQTLIKY